MLRTCWQVCEQLHLHPYLICGSALGAVKYQGFIPWDDDIDIALIRPEYERFLQQAPAMLPSHFFVQNARTDPAFPQLYSKLRLNNTSFIEERAAHLPIHHGVYIDLFPLDGMPPNRIAAFCLQQRVLLCKWKLLSAFGEGGGSRERLLRKLGRLLGLHKHTARAIHRAERIISRYPPSKDGFWCCHGNWGIRFDLAPAAQYGNGVSARFEGLNVRIPAQFESYLTQRYGNWRMEPPISQQHGRSAAIDLHSDHLWRKP